MCMFNTRNLFCLSLALFLLIAGTAAAGAAFSFRNGVTWDTSVSQMIAAEGLAESNDPYNHEDKNGFTFFYLGSRGGADVYYVFRGDQPVTAYTVQSGGAYGGALESATASYGEPSDVSVDTVCALINATNGPGTETPGDIMNLVAWRLSDGTLAALFVIDGDTYMAYFNEQRIGGS